MPRQSTPSQNGNVALNTVMPSFLNERSANRNFSSLYPEIRELFVSNPEGFKDNFNEILQSHLNECYNELTQISDDELIPRIISIYQGFQCIYIIVEDISSENNNGNEITSLIKNTFINALNLENNEDPVIEKMVDQINKIINDARSKEDNVNLENVSIIIHMYSDIKKELLDYLNDWLDYGTETFYFEFLIKISKNNDFSEILTKTEKQFSKEEHIAGQLSPYSSLSSFFYAYMKENGDIPNKFLNGIKPFFIEELQRLKEIPNVTSQDAYQIRWLANWCNRFMDSDNNSPYITMEDLYTPCAEYIKEKMLTLVPTFANLRTTSDISNGIFDLIELAESYAKVYLLIFEGVSDAEAKLEDEMSIAWNDQALNIHLNFNRFLDTQIKNYFRSVTERGVRLYDRERFPKTMAKFKNLIINVCIFEEIYHRNMLNRLFNYGIMIYDIEKPLIIEFRKPDCTSFLSDANELINEMIMSQKIESSFRDRNSIINSYIFQRKDFTRISRDPTYLPESINQYNQEFKKFYQKLYPSENIRLLNDYSQIVLAIPLPNHMNGTTEVTIITTLSIAHLIELIAKSPQSYNNLTQGENGQLTRRRLNKLVDSNFFVRRTVNDDQIISVNMEYCRQRTARRRIRIAEPGS